MASENGQTAHELELLLSSLKAPSIASDVSSLSDLESEDAEILQMDDCHISDGSDDIEKVLPAPAVGQSDRGGAVTSDMTASQTLPDLSGSSLGRDTSPQEDPTHPAPPQTLPGSVISPEPGHPERKAVERLVKSRSGPKEHDPHQVQEPLFPPPGVQPIDREDLEAILLRLEAEAKIRQSSKEPEEAAPPSVPTMATSAKKRQEQIMEQLAELSARQSQGQSLKGGRVDNEGVRPSGHSVSSSANVTEKKVHVGRKENNPTVFIDLRAASSSPNLTAGIGGKPAQKNQRRADVPRSVHTGKSALLQQLRWSKMGPCSPPPDCRAHPPVTGSPELPKKIRSHQLHRSNVKSDVRAGSLPNKEDMPEMDSSFKDGDTAEEHPRKETEEPQKTQESRSTEELTQVEKQLGENKSRQNMQSRIEGMKLQSSASSQRPTAEQTPVLFHLEASYSPEIDTLPPRSGVETLLLTIWLSSCGQLLMPGQHISRYATLPMANAYNALLVWLLSLVAPLNPQYKGDAPFQVLGLQQMWLEEGLALYVCVSPRDVSTRKSIRMLKYKTQGLRGTSNFYLHVSTFLSHHTLQSISSWKEGVIRQLQGRLFPLHLEVPAMRLSSIVMLNPDPQAVEKVFCSPCGFLWKTTDTEEKLSPLAPDFFEDGEIEVVTVKMYDALLQDSLAFHHALHLILTAGLDVCGIRLLYPQSSALCPQIYVVPLSYARRDGEIRPVLVVALRGFRALKIWDDISGPCDPQLARQTDPNSLSALYGLTKESPLLHYSRTSGNMMKDLCLWFGGRIPSNGILSTRLSYSSGRSVPPSSQSPPALLTATTRGDVFLVVSPAVPPCAYGDLIDTCCQQGFAIHGIRRLRLAAKRGAMLNMSAAQVSFFCPNEPSFSPEEKPHAPAPHLHCLLLLLRKENAGHHTAALLQGLMNNLAEQGLLGVIRTSELPVDHTLCFHALPFTDSLLQILGGTLHTVPDSSTVWHMQARRPCSFDPEVEQVVVLTISGRQAPQKAGHFLRQILRPKPKIQESAPGGTEFQGFELLGLKWMPSLSLAQATEITPYEVGENLWQESVDQLASNPALVCVLRRIQAFSKLADVIKELVLGIGKCPAPFFMSATPEVAFRQAIHFFSEKDLVSGNQHLKCQLCSSLCHHYTERPGVVHDSQRRPVLKYLAPPEIYCKSEGGREHRGQTESIFMYMLSGPPLLFTVLLLKPRSWSANLGKIMRKMELQKFVLVGMKLVTLTTEDSLQIIPAEDKEDKTLCQAHCDYLTSAPSLVLCLQRINAVLKLLDVLGPDDPQLCKAQDQFLLRAHYGTSSVQNAMYGSTSYRAAIREIKHFFTDGLVCDHRSIVLEEEQIPRMTQDAIFNSRTQRHTVNNLDCNGGLSPSAGTPLAATLCQTTCLLLPSRALRGSSPAYVQVLEQLSRRAFHITAARLAAFDQSQAPFVAELYSLRDSLSAKFKAEIAGPCLLVAAQRDNAVTCFHSLMASHNLQKDQKSMAFILSPQSQWQAVGMINCFFDSLTPDSIHRIVPQAS
ncbi:dynein axonemal assembly factor 8-like isoform X2 [Dendrobates tinctorius]|uniref:dynein axonemal assembly factor 8-like isoform X2 n=1 Tax=Dendrobates tinctorius TaxID=92724 RepID=UPI003CC95716